MQRQLVLLGIILCTPPALLQGESPQKAAAENGASSSETLDTTLSPPPPLHPVFSEELYRSLEPQCPKIVPKVFEDQVPYGRLGDNNQTMIYKRFAATSFEDCYRGCCGDDSCSMVFIFLNNSKINCYKVGCTKDELCLPVAPDPSQSADKMVNSRFFMVLVRPTEHDYWQNISLKLGATNHSSSGRVCEVGLDLEVCSDGEVCQSLGEKSRNGFCTCKEGLERDVTGNCVQKKDSPPPPVESGQPTAPIKITVQVVSKEVQLPVNQVELVSYALPVASLTNPYSYEWTLLSSSSSKSSAGAAAEESPPKISGTMQDGNKPTLSLTNLEQGSYLFKVVVKGTAPDAYGEALANVTVLPAKHVNQPPKAVIQPISQQINLPTSRAIIDASGSSDDALKEDLTFKWEMVTEPLGYQQTLLEGPTLTLDGLMAGNYTVKLTVTDKDGASDQAVANINVEPEKDYPPTAIAGEDIILYLPQNEVTLHGNLSTDDHGIVSWEWTRKSGLGGQKELAADSTSMRTAFPIISNLEEGTYTFTLKVTDAKGQSSEDEVNIYVKPAVNLPPTANAGVDAEISLPQTWVTLDGSQSKDDIAITSFHWEQLEGPNAGKIVDIKSAVTNVTSLTKGTYSFQLTVMDNLENKDKSIVKITVKQDSNMEPVANAGGEFSVTLPSKVVKVNGSKSQDDLGIVRYLWTRQSGSLAAGRIVGESDQEPVLMLVDLLPGEYTFQLQVWDEQGKTSTDSATFRIVENPERMNVIQAIFNEDLKALTQAKVDTITQSIELLLHNRGKYKVNVIDLFPQMDTGNAIMHFVVVQTDAEPHPPPPEETTAKKPSSSELPDNSNSNVASGKKVVKELQQKLVTDSELLSLKILSLDTLVCQNECSGHGSCHLSTRSCICEPFWMENFIRRGLMDGTSNCDWSIIYVGVFLAAVSSAIVLGLCYFSCRKRRPSLSSIRKSRSNSGRRQQAAKYSRLDQSEPPMELRNAYTSSLMISESESDEEIILEHSSSAINGSVVRSGGLGSGGGLEMQRRNGYSHQDHSVAANA